MKIDDVVGLHVESSHWAFSGIGFVDRCIFEKHDSEASQE